MKTLKKGDFTTLKLVISDNKKTVYIASPENITELINKQNEIIDAVNQLINKINNANPVKTFEEQG